MSAVMVSVATGVIAATDVVAVIAVALIAAGALLLVIAAWGVLRLPDALSRQHAATKAATFALVLIGIGAAVWANDIAWTIRLALIVGFLLATLPVGGHLLARAAVQEAGLDDAVRAAPVIDPPENPVAMPPES